MRQELHGDRVAREQVPEREIRALFGGVEIHVDLGEQIAPVLHPGNDARALAHPVMRPGEEAVHALAAFERAAAALHRAVLGEPARHQALVVACEEIGDVGFVIEGHSSSRTTASAARL